MDLIRLYGGNVNRPMIFSSHTHTSVQTIDSSNHPVHPMLSLLILCALHRNMGGLILRAEWSRYERTC